MKERDADMIESIEMWLHECEPQYVEKELAWLDELRTRLIEEEIPKDLEEAAKNYAELLPQGRVSKKYSAIDFIAGYNLCKEQMLNEAVEGTVTANLANRPVIYLDNLHGFNIGDKVHLVIIKEG